MHQTICRRRARVFHCAEGHTLTNRFLEGLWRYTKEVAHLCWRGFWFSVRSWLETFSIMVGGLYLWASYHEPHGHLLNWPEFRAVFFDVFNRFIQHLGAMGCGQ